MKENNILLMLNEILEQLKPLERKGLDTSSLKIFIKNLKSFISISIDNLSEVEKKDNDLKFINTELPIRSNVGLDDKLFKIKIFLEDREAFPRISDVIKFANERLGLNFKDQKESRATTIKRILNRISKSPRLRVKLKEAVINIRNEKLTSNTKRKSKKDIISAETFANWVEILKDL